jgi:hypothetical protein
MSYGKYFLVELSNSKVKVLISFDLIVTNIWRSNMLMEGLKLPNPILVVKKIKFG